ncbi:MAG: carboxypeptidase-like regulatory domain-containing protein [Gammaproteobacteria bacterium]|jgi:hypothetical protein|nr:carboxypeptidase-like regulatory domain-containing protein [Gammaproteobacteria bacterium]HJP37238.1 carboxypeptidase-like regulatory domain-containing protein [Gammaproteobacteria bacterium]
MKIRGAYSASLVLVGAMLLAGTMPAFAAGYSEIEVNGGGSVAGKLTFEGALPEDAIEKISINKNPDVCDVEGTGYREIVWVDVADGALRGAFVFIDKIKEGKAWAEPEGGNYVINQEGCRFRPWAQVMKPGPIIIRHSDPDSVLHNINTREMIGVEKGKIVKRTMFNFGQPEPGDIEKKLTPRRSPFIAMNCEAHNFMFGFMMAPKHPYAVVVGEDGSYSIDNVPPGTYKVKAWHPRFGLKETELTVPEGGSVEADFSFSM